MFSKAKNYVRRAYDVVGDLLADGSVRVYGTGLALVGAGSTARAADTSAADGAAAVTGLVAGQSGYLTAMISLALAAVGILIAVKWVKRARGAA